MKKILSILSAVSLLVAMFVVAAIPSSAASPAVSDWYAVQEVTCPTHTHAWFEKGRVNVESIVNGSEPGAGTVIYTKPVDLNNFEVSFSLDSYTKCKDQYIGMGFINKGTDLQANAALGSYVDPYFWLMLRPTEEATEIDCAQGLLANYDTDRKKVRVGFSNFAPGVYFEGTTQASWSNVVFKVCRNQADTGYEISINGKVVSNQNDWWFVDDIEETTGSDDWYFFVQFKDGNYAPVKYTIKTINGQPAVDKSATGFMKNSLLLEGEKYADGVDGGSSNTTSTTKKKDTTTTKNDKTTAGSTTTTVGGGTSDTAAPSGTDATDPSATDPVDPSATDPSTEVTEPSSGDGDTSSTAPTSGTQADDQTGDDVDDKDGGSLTWLWIVLGVVVVAGVAVVLVVLRKKKA